MISVFGANTSCDEGNKASDCIKNGWMGLGNKVSEFEDTLKNYLNLPTEVVMLNSGSSALTLAIKLLDLPIGSTIIVPTFTWIACANAVILNGYKIKFCDVELSGNISKKQIEKIWDASVKAIMIVHYAGFPVDVDEIKSFGVPIVEDAAHAIVTKYNDKPAGSLGDVSIFSFDSIKNLATPEGGAIMCQNEEKIRLAKNIRYCGIGKSGFSNSMSCNNRWWQYPTHGIWHKMIPNDVSASVGLEQLKKLSSNQSRRKEIWEIYQQAFNKFETPPNYDYHSYFTYLLRIKNRDELARKLLDNDIYTTLRYHPLHLNDIYECKESFTNSELLSETALNLPLHPRMSDNDVDRVVELVRKFAE